MTNNEKPDIWLHVHVPKAGGSTLRHLMSRNFRNAYYNSTSLLEIKQYECDDIRAIITNHRWLKCFSDHKLSLDLPFDHRDSTVYALTFVRDPVDRFISRYFFYRHFQQVECLAQTASLREFAEAELIRGETHPSTNSQVYFLNGFRSHTDMTVIEDAIATQRGFVFPVERFDDACVCLERLHPEAFSDLSYVTVNVSKKDKEILAEDREFVRPFLENDYPLIEIANQHLDDTIDRAFENQREFEKALKEFQHRCNCRVHNFKPGDAKRAFVKRLFGRKWDPKVTIQQTGKDKTN